MIEASYQVAVLLISVHLPEAQSLKDKRMVIKSVKEKIKARLNVCVAEIDGQDKWQVATLGFSMIAADPKLLESSVQAIISMVESNPMLVVCEKHLEYL